VVCALLEEGEHGYLAARTAAKVIKAYVDKQRQLPPKMADKSKPADKPKPDGKVDVGAVWTTPDPDGGKDKLQGGHFMVDVERKRTPLATAAPGLN
jgi:hypothetical protein